MEVVNRNLKDLHPYEKNAKKHTDNVDKIAESIKKYGFRHPILIDNNGVIIAGHGRYEASKKLKLKTVPVIIADDLTPEQVREYRLVDNKVAESEWDLDLLNEELLDIGNIDLGDFGFDIPEITPIETEEPKKDEESDDYWGHTKEITTKAYNMEFMDELRWAGKWQMPFLKATHHRPTDLIEFAKTKTQSKFEKGVHFYEWDYQFERIWTTPMKYMPRLAQFDCCLTPDFSLFTDFPLAMQVWNVYRSRQVGQIMQDYGITVIPINFTVWSK